MPVEDTLGERLKRQVDGLQKDLGLLPGAPSPRRLNPRPLSPNANREQRPIVSQCVVKASLEIALAARPMLLDQGLILAVADAVGKRVTAKAPAVAQQEPPIGCDVEMVEHVLEGPSANQELGRISGSAKGTRAPI